MTRKCKTMKVCMMGAEALCREPDCPPTINSDKNATSMFKTAYQLMKENESK